jgi:hypothetical protein
MKRKLFILALLALCCTACHKNCVCTGYNGAERTYSSDEVDALGGSCSNLIIQANTRYYSYCRWE